jgi:hypothetical protein
MVKHICFVVLIYVAVTYPLYALSEKQDSTIRFLPDSRIFPEIFLDPLECQTSGGSYLLFRKEKDLSLYSTVNLGFTKPFLAWKTNSLSWECNLGAAVFTQFELIRKEDGSYLAGLINNDYKISADISMSYNTNIFKLRIFHLSSHIGDDYFLRYQDTVLNDKSENYEQVDLTFLKLYGVNYWYAGIGEIYTKYVFRERFSLVGGGLLNFAENKPFNLFASINVKLLAENDFVPDLRTAFGASFNRKSESQIRIWLEYYNGQLPYSTLDYGRVNWIGLALLISLR